MDAIPNALLTSPCPFLTVQDPATNSAAAGANRGKEQN